MPIKCVSRYTQEDINSNPMHIFVFGDNMCRYGMGGQAKIARNSRNAVGIPTKWKPSNDRDAYFSDEDFAFVAPVIRGDFRKLQLYLEQGMTIVWPIDGIGTGRAQLRTRAPTIWRLIETHINELAKIYGSCS